MLYEIDYKNVFFVELRNLSKSSINSSKSLTSIISYLNKISWIKKAIIIVIVTSISLIESLS